MDSNRRTILTTGAAVAATAAVPQVFAQQGGQGGGATSFYEKGNVRIHYQEIGSGFPLLVTPGGGRTRASATGRTRFSTRWTFSRTTSAASQWISATLAAANPRVRSQSMIPGAPSPTTNWV